MLSPARPGCGLRAWCQPFPDCPCVGLGQGARYLGRSGAEQCFQYVILCAERGGVCVRERVHRNPGERTRVAGRRVTSVPSEFEAM